MSRTLTATFVLSLTQEPDGGVKRSLVFSTVSQHADNDESLIDDPEMVAWRELAEALAERDAPKEPTRDEVLAFLHGRGPLLGVWFGEKPAGERGNFWWRKYLHVLQEPADSLTADFADPTEGANWTVGYFDPVPTPTRVLGHREGGLYTVRYGLSHHPPAAPGTIDDRGFITTANGRRLEMGKIWIAEKDLPQAIEHGWKDTCERVLMVGGKNKLALVERLLR